MEYKNLPHLFELSAGIHAGRVMLWEKKHDKYEGMTYAQVEKQLHLTCLGLLNLGLEKGDRVALISEGRNDWVIGELAVLFCGAVSVPLSVKIEEAADLLFRLRHSACKGVIVSGNHKHKVFGLLDQLEHLEFVVLLDPAEEADVAACNVHSKKLIDIDTLRTQDLPGREQLEEKLQRVKDSLRADDYANICYTSGTTADPKGIILSHQNYLHNVEQASLIFDVPPEYTSLHILPWDHSFAHTVGIYALIRNGASLASLKVGKTLNETLRNIPICIREIRPHFLLSVPALAKTFKRNIEQGVKAKGAIAWWLFRLGLKTAYAYNREGYNKGGGMRNLLKPLYRLFDKMLFGKIRAGFGGRLQFFVGGGALLDIELQRFFYAIGMPMFQGYGLTEAAPVISSNTPTFHKMGSSGKVVPRLDLKICSDDGREKPIGGQGEIVVRGENVMVGYWDNEEATSEVLRDGWLYTGDLGYLDKDGYLYVLGRTKSLLIGSDGEKYSPEGIEEAIMEKSAYFDQIMLYNNQSAYTAALAVVNKAAVLQHLKRHNVSAESEQGQQLALDKLRDELNRFMPGGEFEGMFPPRWMPTAVALIPEAFSEANGMVNSTMKIVRPVIHAHYRETLSGLFTPEGKDFYNEANRKVIAALSA